MRKNIIIGASCIAVGLLAGWLIFGKPAAPGGGIEEKKVLYWTDPMIPGYRSDKPGKSPMGMDLVPVYADETGESGKKKIAYYKDPMHPWFTSDKPGKAPDCGMDMVPVYEEETSGKGIKIDPLVIQNIGVKTEEVRRRPMTKTIRTVGKVTYDETKLYNVNTKIMGWVEKLYVDYAGKAVHKGDPLLDIYSPDLVNTEEEYLLALRYRDGLQASSAPEAKKGSEDLVASARRRLLYWDISPQEIREIEKQGVPKKVMTIYSPAEGIVVEKMIVNGQNIMAGMTLYKIADLSDVWILADIYQYELPWVKLGQHVDIELSYLSGKTFRGRITYIYPYLSEETKTAKVRIEVPNTRSIDLKPDMYATVKISSGVAVEAITVPDQAIIRSGERSIAVISLGGGYFEPREVKLGLQSEGLVQILDGIKEGEKIVVSSQFLIDSESNLKAAISQMGGHSERETPPSMEQPRPDETIKSGRKTEAPKEPVGRSPGSKEAVRKKKIQPVKAKKSAVETIDPVCGMNADPSGKFSFAYNDKTYYFCSEEDMEKFKNEPARYVSPVRPD